MRINKEGYKIIGISGAVCLLIWWLFYRMLVNESGVALLWGGTIFLLLFWFFIVAFFREPRRVRIHDADLVFAPCDGRVVVTEVVKETEYLQEEMLQISIFMSITNVHMNWVPVGGTVEYFKYHPGRFLVAWHPKSSTENERTTTVVKMPTGQRVLFRQVAGLIARRIISYMKVGNPVEDRHPDSEGERAAGRDRGPDGRVADADRAAAQGNGPRVREVCKRRHRPF